MVTRSTAMDAVRSVPRTAAGLTGGALCGTIDAASPEPVEVSLELFPAWGTRPRMNDHNSIFCFQRKQNTMKRIAIAAVVWGLWASVVPPLAAQDAPPETGRYTGLFNGKDLRGWDGDPRLWSVVKGVIHGETTEKQPANGNTFLIYQGGEFGDFELRFSFRCTSTNNSGVQYRSKHITDGNVRNAWVVRGYQHEIRNETQLPNVAGFIYGEGIGRGRICLVGEKAVWGPDGKRVLDTLIDQEGFEKLFRLDDWNDSIIVARGNHIQHYLNGKLIVDFTDREDLVLRKGIVALQLHAGKPMWVEFRDIRIKELK